MENVTTIEEELNKGIPTSSMARENPEIGMIEIANAGYQDVKVNIIVVFDSQDIIIMLLVLSTILMIIHTLIMISVR